MYTGIIKQNAIIENVEKKDGLHTFYIDCPEGFLSGVENGASIAVNGVCLTVTSFSDVRFTADAMQETLRVTTLGGLVKGQSVHVERSARVGDEIGGHALSGHIDTTARVVNIKRSETNCVLSFELDSVWTPYIFNKGYIAIDGASLTLSDVNKEQARFNVWLIPETLRRTHFSELAVGDLVNIEIDRNTQVLVDTIRNTLIEMREIS